MTKHIIQNLVYLVYIGTVCNSRSSILIFNIYGKMAISFLFGIRFKYIVRYLYVFVISVSKYVKYILIFCVKGACSNANYFVQRIHFIRYNLI